MILTLSFINQPDFVMANKFLDDELKQKKRAGDEAAVVQKQPISDDDWQRIMKLFKDVATTDDLRLMTRYVRFS